MLSMMCWADNIYSFATTLSGACQRLQCLELFLQRTLGLCFQDGSRQILLGKGHDACTAPDGWELVQVLPVLGHTLRQC
jgi:hypothetical protein